MADSAEPRPWLPLTEAAERLGLSYRTLRRRRAAGDLSTTTRHHNGREVLGVTVEELLRFAAAEGISLGSAEARPPAAQARPVDSLETRPGDGALLAEKDARIASLEKEAEALRAQVRWLQEHADRLTLALPAPQDGTARQDGGQRRRGLWARLFGRREVEEQ